MRIGINYTPALRQRAGIGRYTRGIVNALADLDTQNQYTLVISKDSPLEKASQFPENFKIKVLPVSERLLTIMWYRLNLPLAVDRWAGPFDLFHSPDFVLPPLHKSPGVVTVHDLSFMRHPEGAVPKLRNWLNNVVPKSISRAKHVLADSNSTKADLEALLGVSADKITVIGAGVAPHFKTITDVDILSRVRQKYHLPKRFILGLGTLEPRKNFEGLIAAFNSVGPEYADTHLVIAGAKGWLYESIFEAAAQSPISEKIHLIGFVDDDDLPALYNLACMFAYPSHYEGFGIPVLEAMACGTPVVSANNSSLPEVAGKAALLVPATDIHTLANALRELITSPLLCEKLVKKGYEQPLKYSWEGAVREILGVYRLVASL